MTKKHDELQDKVFEYSTEHKNFTTLKLKAAVLGKKPEDFWKFSEEVLAKYKAESRIGTCDKISSILGESIT